MTWKCTREFSFCRHFRSCFYLGQPPGYGRLGERLPANTTLEKTVSRPPSAVLDRSRSALGLSPSVVVDDRLDANEQVVGKTDCPDDAHNLEVRYDEHDLRNRSWGG